MSKPLLGLTVALAVLALKGEQAIALGLPVSAQAAPADAHDPAATGDLDVLIHKADQLPTPSIFTLSTRLFESGRRDEGVFWYYVAGLRGRMEGMSNDVAAQAYGAIFETVGPTFNEYAGADISKWTRTMGQALAWDEKHPLQNVDPKIRTQVRSGLVQLRDWTLAHKAEIRATRAKNGLTNSPQ